jgi:hypothetical protein
MIEWIITGAVVGITTLSVAAIRHQKTKRAMQAAAEELGLDYVQRSGLAVGRIVGTMGSLDVTVMLPNRKNPLEVKTSIILKEARDCHVPNHTPFRQDIQVIAKGLLTPEGQSSLDVGDAIFHSLTVVNGDRAASLAVLDHTTRTSILHAIREGSSFSIKNGFLSFLDRRILREPEDICDRIRQLTQIAASFALAKSAFPERLAINVRHDPSDDVRQANLSMLLQTFPDSPPAQDVARHLLAKKVDPSTRLMVKALLKQLGDDEGCELLASSDIDEPIRMVGIARLDFNKADDLAVLRTLRNTPTPAVQAWAVRITGSVDRSEWVAWLSEQNRGDMADAMVDAAVGILEGIDNHHPVAEEAMVLLIPDSPTPFVVAVVNALAGYGTTAVVEDLLPLSEGALRASAIKDAARAAISRIQARGPAASKGGLTLADTGAAGQLSLDGQAGAISLEPSENHQDPE